MDLYTLGRVSAIAIKPLIIYFLINFVGIEDGNAIAKTFVLIAIALILINTDVYRNFYINFFNHKKIYSSYSGFIIGTFVLSLIGFIIIFLIYKIYLSASYTRSILVALFFLSEKLADECLRFKLYAKDFQGWGEKQLLKSAMIGILSLFIFFISELNQVEVLLIIILINFLVFGKYFPYKYLRRIYKSKFRNKIIYKSGFLYNFKHKKFLMLAIFTTSVAHIDRMIALVASPEKIAILILIINCFSIMVMLFDFYYLSFKRQDFLTGKISIKSALAGFEIWRILIIGAFISTVACFFILSTSVGAELVVTSDIVGIFSFQLIACLSYIAYNILYWNNKIFLLIKTDIFFWLSFFAIQYLLFIANSGNEILVAAGMIFLRFIYLSQQASKIKK